MTSCGHLAGAHKRSGVGTQAGKLFLYRQVVWCWRSVGEERKSFWKAVQGQRTSERASHGDGERKHQKGPLDRAGRPPTGLNRTGKSCRLRWVNYLHPGLKHGRMTPQEEHLVLELHAKWGNRWSRIARRLPGRTDNEIKNYWRTHMRKKAQERKRSLSLSFPPVSTSSSSSNLSSSLSDPPSRSEAGVEKPELDGVGEGTSSMTTTGFEENELEEEGVKDYPMDQFWNEIDTSELSFEGHKDDEAGINVLCPSMPSPMWDYCPDSLWVIDDDDDDDDEFKLLPPMGDTTIRES